MTALQIAKALTKRESEHHGSPSSSQEANSFLTLSDAAALLLKLSPACKITAAISENAYNRLYAPEGSVTSENSTNCVDSRFKGTKIQSGNESPSPTIVSVISISRVDDRTFAESLMDMLLDDQYSGIITFLPDGQQFGIIHSKKFCEQVMPKVFGIRTFSSFVRKLNRWGFERVMEKKTHDVDIFRHELFVKGNWAACARIKCVGHRPKSNLENRFVYTHAYQNTQQQEMHALMQAQLSRRAKMTRIQVYFHHQLSLHDMTTQVVGAALETLRRDEAVAVSLHAPVSNLQMHLGRQRQIQDIQANQPEKFAIHDESSPRSSICVFPLS